MILLQIYSHPKKSKKVMFSASYIYLIDIFLYTQWITRKLDIKEMFLKSEKLDF